MLAAFVFALRPSQSVLSVCLRFCTALHLHGRAGRPPRASRASFISHSPTLHRGRGPPHGALGFADNIDACDLAASPPGSPSPGPRPRLHWVSRAATATAAPPPPAAIGPRRGQKVKDPSVCLLLPTPRGLQTCARSSRSVCAGLGTSRAFVPPLLKSHLLRHDGMRQGALRVLHCSPICRVGDSIPCNQTTSSSFVLLSRITSLSIAYAGKRIPLVPVASPCC